MLVPVRILLRSLSPAVLAGFAPSLDGILFEAVSQLMPDANDEQVLAELKTLLQFNEDLGVFHASSLTFGITPDAGLTAKTSVRADCWAIKGLSSADFLAQSRRGYSRVRTEGGPSKIRINERPSYAAPWFIFDAVGDATRIEMLLQYAFVGVGYDINTSANGEFAFEAIYPIDEDLSLMNNGKACRVLPADCGADGVPDFSPLLPPYYTGKKVAVIRPEVVRYAPLQSLLS